MTQKDFIIFFYKEATDIASKGEACPHAEVCRGICSSLWIKGNREALLGKTRRLLGCEGTRI